VFLVGLTGIEYRKPIYFIKVYPNPFTTSTTLAIESRAKHVHHGFHFFLCMICLVDYQKGISTASKQITIQRRSSASGNVVLLPTVLSNQGVLGTGTLMID